LSYDDKLKKSLFELYQSAVDTQLQLQPLLFQLDEQAWDESIPGTPGAKAYVDRGVVWFNIPSVPPMMKGTSYRLQQDIRDRWMRWIVYAYVEAGIEVSFDQALVVITIYTKGKHVWDTDNRSVHAILNGIRSCRLVTDDDWSHLSYLVRGFGDCEVACTKVAVLDCKNWDALSLVLDDVNN